VKADPEIRDLRQIIFEVVVPLEDEPHFVEALNRWTSELMRICPAPLVGPFCLLLLRR
jgi:hypothetical protein